MDRQVRWLPAAVDDLDEIAAFIATDSPAYASAVVSRVLSLAAGLGGLPHIGRRVPEWGDEAIRERVACSYRLIYRVSEDDVLIIALIHGARLLKDELRDRTE